MVNTNNLKHRLMAVRFAMWELHLYLDTHKCDEQAKQLLESYKEKYNSLLEEYECKYGPLSAMCGSGEDWVGCVFPWVNCGSDC